MQVYIEDMEKAEELGNVTLVSYDEIVNMRD